MESREILQITIELGDQETDVIKVHENDEPADLAAEFCKRHGLDAKNLEILTNLIEQNIDLLIESEIKKSTCIIKTFDSGQTGSRDFYQIAKTFVNSPHSKKIC